MQTPPKKDSLPMPFAVHTHQDTRAYASDASLALPLVTLTPSCLARLTISMRLREETACAILRIVLVWRIRGWR